MTLLKTVLMCGCACGLVLTLSGCEEEQQAAEPPRPVRTVIATPATIGEEVAQTGEVRANVETELGFRIGGRIATRTAIVGTSVEQGQVLATLDTSDVQNEVGAAEAEVRSAEAAEEVARSTLERQRILFEREIVARARIEEVEGNWQSAAARLNVARNGLQTALNKLTYTELRAPDAGIVSGVAANAGQVVSPGQPVVQLASTRERDAVFNVSERLYTTVPSDVQVEVALVSDPSIKIIGPVRDASPTADPATRTYRVRIALPNAPEAMALGAAVTGRVVLPGKPLIVVPSSALTSEDGKPAVFVVSTDSNELVRKAVVVARYTPTQALVESGLAEGDAVVTAGVSKLRPGQKVAYEAGEAAE